MYKEELRTGFEPDWVCEDDAEFARAFVEHFQVPLLLSSLPGDVEALGLAYAHVLSSETIYLLARVEDDPVLVFVDRMEARGGRPLESPAELHLFSKRLGDLILYELTPRQEARLLDAFTVPPRD